MNINSSLIPNVNIDIAADTHGQQPKRNVQDIDFQSFISESLSKADSNRGLVRLLIQKLNNSALADWKLTLRKVIEDYLVRVPHLDEGNKQKLSLLSEELGCQSLHELRLKYSFLFFKQRKPNVSDESAFYFALLASLFTEKAEQAVRQEEAALADSLTRKQFDWAAVYRDEMLRILVVDKREKWVSKKRSFDCYVVEHRDFAQCLTHIEKTFHTHQLKEQRCFFIVRNDVHYTAIDCQYINGEKRSIVLDASQDPKHLILKSTLESQGFNVITAGANEDDKIQWDGRSCSLFSFSQLVQMAKMRHAFDEFVQHPLFNQHTKRIPWAALTPKLIEDAQNAMFLSAYLANNKQKAQALYKKQQTLEDYMEKRLDHSRAMETERNTGIERKLEKYTSTVLKKIASSSHEELATIACQHPFAAIC